MNRIFKIATVCALLAGCALSFTDSGKVEAEKNPKMKNFSVYVNGKIYYYKTAMRDIDDALREQGLIFRKDLMFPKPSSKLIEGTKIFLLKQGERFEFREYTDKNIPTIYVNDATVDYGTEKIVDPGVAGVDKVIVKVNADGQEQELGRIHKVLPQKAVIHKGIKDCVMTENGLKHFKKKFVAEVTAYTIEDGNGDGVTSIGMVPYEGVVAVDPRFIPYHSKLYIPGYGVAIAGDTGGAINDNCIDLFLYDRSQAWHWGRRFIEVYLLDS